MREIAMKWWNSLVYGEKCLIYTKFGHYIVGFPDRDIYALTGREIEILYNETQDSIAIQIQLLSKQLSKCNLKTYLDAWFNVTEASIVEDSIIKSIIKYCEDNQIYDKLGNYNDFYYKLKSIANVTRPTE